MNYSLTGNMHSGLNLWSEFKEPIRMIGPMVSSYLQHGYVKFAALSSLYRCVATRTAGTPFMKR
jgi:hypothetical protein